MKTTTPASGSCRTGEEMPNIGNFEHKAIAIYPKFADVGDALLLLNKEGFTNGQISLLGREQAHWQEKLGHEWETLKTTKGALGGAALGAVPGLVLLTGIALTGGVGVLVAGPMIGAMSALGMGSLVGGLMGAGSSKIDSAEKTPSIDEEVADAISHGHWVIVVHTRSEAEATRAQALLPNRCIDRENESKTRAPSDLAAEEVDIKKLGEIVEEAFESVAKVSERPPQEVLCTVDQINGAELKQAAQEAMKKMADATDLHAAQISGILKANGSAGINDIVNRLHEQSKVKRSTF
ncbi:MAG: hypothetical protein ABSH33_18300 [Steroidobacteraceae bacterium]|jgi:hypothetical protein